jgi:hypothetical protein
MLKKQDNWTPFIALRDSSSPPSQKILTHWLTYIMDRQMPVFKVWYDGALIISEIVEDYLKENRKGVEEIVAEYKKGKYLISKKSQAKFVPRYYNQDYACLLKTLKILESYEKNLVLYILNIINTYENREDLLLRIANALWLLTYALTKTEKDVLAIMNNESLFERELIRFKQMTTEGKKRLWCCLRDYTLGSFSDIFVRAIEEIYENKSDANKMTSLWRNLRVEQIELPGDVWNNNLKIKNYLLAKAVSFNEKTKRWNMPKVIRYLFENLKAEALSLGFYPVRFDVTFLFVPNMCEKGMCELCLFSNNDMQCLCPALEGKYCPPLLLLGAAVKCHDQSCVVREGLSQGICLGIPRLLS